jgi:hypothetical protein
MAAHASTPETGEQFLVNAASATLARGLLQCDSRVIRTARNIVGRQAEASRTSAVISALRNMRPRPVRTLVQHAPGERSMGTSPLKGEVD